MSTKLPEIYFYLPNCEKLENDFPDVNTYLPSQFRDGIYAWILQTFLHLKNNGFPCRLVGEIPDEGIVMVHRSSIPNYYKPPSKVMLVCMMADKERHPFAAIHIVLNRQDMILKQGKFWESYFIPHWTQPGLIPRNINRGNLFKNLAYFGHERNLAPELKDNLWYEQIADLGLNFQIVDRQKWNDFSEIDAVIAVRSFDKQTYPDKPATKLYNCWLAGVPVILGTESAYQAERKSNLDYIQVTSLDDTLNALKSLKDDADLRQSMIDNGKHRAEEIKSQQTVKIWMQTITEKIVPAYYRWQKLSIFEREIFYARRYFSIKKIHIQNRF